MAPDLRRLLTSIDMLDSRFGATEPHHAGPLDLALPQLLGELRLLARRALAREGSTHTLQTADLIQEAYLRLAKDPTVASRGKRYFWAAAARAMRQVLIDAARRRRAVRHGGEFRIVSLDAIAVDETPRDVDELSDELLALDTALTALEAHNPRSARVVECRFVGGMSVEDTAAALGVSARTVKSDWAFARAWLRDALRAQVND